MEKFLKARVVAKTKIVAPRTHNLLKLAEISDTSLDDVMLEFLGKLMTYNLEGRYPSEVYLKPSRDFAREMIETGKRVIEWLKQQ